MKSKATNSKTMNSKTMNCKTMNCKTMKSNDSTTTINSTTSIDLSTTIHNNELLSPIYNASGVYCTEKDDILKLNSNPFCGAIVSKSTTLEFRIGNPHPRYNDMLGTMSNSISINSMGIPNHGIDYYLNISDNITNKPYFISLGGLTLDENLKLFGKIHDGLNDIKLDGIEYNLSCPNIPSKPQTGLDFEAMDNSLRRVFEAYDKLPCTGIKLPPYFDPSHWNSAIDVIGQYKNRLSFLTCINSIGNGLAIDAENETTIIYPKMGYGGIGGSCIKYTALANVRAFYNAFKGDLDIIGCGGVTSGLDVFEHILCGANAVQIGTQIAKFGLNEFQRIHNELLEIMRRKNYKSISDFKGNLKVIECE